MALDFLILYEHIVRELDCDALLMAELERRGYSVELFQLMDRKKLRYFFCKKPKVIVTSAMYNNETLNSFVYNNVGKVDRVVNLHWEEVLSREQEESDFYNLNENAAKCTHICWGNAARDRIVKNGVPAGNAVVTGALHLDFFLPQFESLMKTREQLAEEFSIDPAHKWLCYISSFSCAQMDDKEIAELNAKLAATQLDDFVKNAEQVGDVKVVTGYVKEASADVLRSMCEKAKSTYPDAVAVIATANGDKVTFAAGVGKNALALGANAGKIVKAVAQAAGGNGGGKPDLAMAGAKDASKIDEALAIVSQTTADLLK